MFFVFDVVADVLDVLFWYLDICLTNKSFWMFCFLIFLIFGTIKNTQKTILFVCFVTRLDTHTHTHTHTHSITHARAPDTHLCSSRKTYKSRERDNSFTHIQWEWARERERGGAHIYFVYFVWFWFIGELSFPSGVRPALHRSRRCRTVYSITAKPGTRNIGNKNNQISIFFTEFWKLNISYRIFKLP